MRWYGWQTAAVSVGVYLPSFDQAADRGVRRAKRLRENTDNFMIACRCGVLTGGFPKGVGLQQVLENVGAGANGLEKE
jgi:hypothetical protein